MKHCYLVAVQVFFKNTGNNATSTIDLTTDFRITRETMPALLDRVKEALIEKDPTSKVMLKDAIVTIIAFSKFED